jgi:hypothetical protein
MVIHSGGKASGFKNSKEVDTARQNGTIDRYGSFYLLLLFTDTALYHVRGTNPLNTRGVQVDAQASSLNSNDSFVLLTPQGAYLWYGKGSNNTEKASAKKIAELLKGQRKLTEFEEGNESQDFWNALGGKAEYATGGSLSSDDHAPRLFQCSNATGTFRIEEVFNFNQVRQN